MLTMPLRLCFTPHVQHNAHHPRRGGVGGTGAMGWQQSRPAMQCVPWLSPWSSHPQRCSPWCCTRLPCNVCAALAPAILPCAWFREAGGSGAKSRAGCPSRTLCTASWTWTACWQVLCLECSRVLGNCCVDAESVGRCAGAAGKLRCFASDAAGRRATAVWTQHSVGGLSALPTSTCLTVAARTPSLAPTHRRSQLALPRAHAPGPGLGGCVAAAHASQLGPHVELAGPHWESDRPGKQSGELLLQRCGRLGE